MYIKAKWYWETRTPSRLLPSSWTLFSPLIPHPSRILFSFSALWHTLCSLLISSWSFISKLTWVELKSRYKMRVETKTRAKGESNITWMDGIRPLVAFSENALWDDQSVNRESEKKKGQNILYISYDKKKEKNHRIIFIVFIRFRFILL